ncbi:MAG: sulfatase [Saprospiraceae bacterium]|nr:sulfatase [Saprospiraceae bacterium]
MKRILLWICFSCICSAFLLNKPKASSPNIILIFADDLGYGDLSCYGALQYQTPHLDQLANEGIRFTNFLSAQAVCSASRAALLTGCYPNRVSISGALSPNAKVGLHPDEKTIAEVLKEKGYATAIYGKWHLGDHPNFLPTKQGFDEYIGLPYSNDMWPIHFDGKPITDESNYRKKAFPYLPLLHNTDTIQEIRTLEDQAKLTNLYTKHAINFIKKNKKKPFFLYLPHSMPHVPIAASAKFKGKSKQGLYGDVIMELDWSVGEIMKTLKENNLDKNTLVIFTSDNGPWINYGNHAGSSGGLREGKGTSFEGGHRVPCILRWKGTTPEGLVCNKLASTIDLLPTIATVCDAKLPNRKIDGVNILSLLKGDMETTPRKYFYYYYRKNHLEAVRRDDWKLVLEHTGRSYEGQLPGNEGFPGDAPENHPFPMGLYDLRRDPAERYDVKELYPDIYNELLRLAETARGDLGDEITNRKGKNVRDSGLAERN